MFTVGDRVKKVGHCYYSHSGDHTGIEIGSVGMVVAIRSRYENTPNAYKLYIVQFDEKELLKGLDDQYSEYDLEKII
jgi:hypothetical protein